MTERAMKRLEQAVAGWEAALRRGERPKAHNLRVHVDDVRALLDRARRTPTSEGGRDVAQDADRMHGSEGGEREALERLLDACERELDTRTCLRSTLMALNQARAALTPFDTGGTDGK